MFNGHIDEMVLCPQTFVDIHIYTALRLRLTAWPYSTTILCSYPLLAFTSPNCTTRILTSHHGCVLSPSAREDFLSLLSQQPLQQPSRCSSRIAQATYHHRQGLCVVLLCTMTTERLPHKHTHRVYYTEFRTEVVL